MMSQDGRVIEALLEAGSSPLDPRRDPGAFDPGAALRLAIASGVTPPRTPDGARKMLDLLPSEERSASPEERLFRAVESHYPDLVQLLLTAGVEPGSRDRAGTTCLHAAAQNGDLRSVRLLLAAYVSTDVNAPNDEGSTPLHLACGDGGAQPAILQALLEAGARPPP